MRSLSPYNMTDAGHDSEASCEYFYEALISYNTKSSYTKKYEQNMIGFCPHFTYIREPLSQPHILFHLGKLIHYFTIERIQVIWCTACYEVAAYSHFLIVNFSARIFQVFSDVFHSCHITSIQ